MLDASDSASPLSYQARFHRAWGHLTRPAVRALAWLLDSPDLLDPASPHWQDRIATLGPPSAATATWLAALDADPAPLDAALGNKFYSRLGLYAEKLMAFYFEQHGVLQAHGLQVRSARNETVGEFDFLLRQRGELVHIEFATKFYLLDGQPDPGNFNRLVGPNLADTLGLKMRKIFAQQLQLAWHPAAQAMLAQPVDKAQALIKGWLFYPQQNPPVFEGVSPGHCRGHWRTLEEFGAVAGERFVVMPRLQWLAPLKATAAPVNGEPAPTPPAQERDALQALLREKFAQDPSPVMVATVREEAGWLLETERAFVVPDDWRERAAARRSAGDLPS
ncbi:DUF1853 family protein [Massilia sp. erpn]|uniref:DUF1853 family protein n=1 Tax=Massilia sp. erpn TaxID=2738142 RepID=UPI002103E2B5|nr:DUF1853 family protein [Massilia sp. erpn]UTY60208.1 DUF1853 family protein [Massilia sp. erpn]